MASGAALPEIDSSSPIDAYRRQAGSGDAVSGGDAAAWAAAVAALGGDLAETAQRGRRHSAEVGADFRIGNQAAPSAFSPLPLLIAAAEWCAIEAGIIQRATLLEAVLTDLYGPAALVTGGALPAALVAGSPGFLRALAGLPPPGGRQLRIAAFDLIRDPGGGWRVIGDRVRGLAGLGRALENRLAGNRTLPGLLHQFGGARHAPFFTALRDGIAAACRRAEPRIAILNGGRNADDHDEAAHLARYLGFLLVEDADLAALDGRLYLRTIAGLKRVDALWSLVEPHGLDPLAFDASARGGVPGLIDTYAADALVVANAPGAALIEAPAFGAFLPALAERLTGAPLALPNIATWWAGGAMEAAYLRDHLQHLRVAPAFGVATLGLDGIAPVAGGTLPGDRHRRLVDDLARRPQDYVGQEVLARATMPVVEDRRLTPRPFTLRVFAARGGDDAWSVLPGGLACIDGGATADVIVHGRRDAAVGSLIGGEHVRLRRNPGTLPSRAADGFYWLGRYLERGEALVGAIRAAVGGSSDSDGAALLSPEATGKLTGLVAPAEMPIPSGNPSTAFRSAAREAMTGSAPGSLGAIDAALRRNAAGLSERLAPDMIRLIEAPPPTMRGLGNRAAAAADRFAAIAGLAAEHLSRTAGWHFLDLGRRVERAMTVARLLRQFALSGTGADDLALLLDLADSRIGYRQRYPGIVARLPVIDLVALNPANPRSLAYQLATIGQHLAALPVLADDGMVEPQQAQAATLAAIVTTAAAARVDADLLADVERRLALLSDAIARRYFLQGAEPLRASGLTLA